jgi:ribosome-binding factor A
MSNFRIFVPEKAPSFRVKKMNGEIQKIIAQVLARGNLPPVSLETESMLFLTTPVTVTDVSTAPDCAHATVFVMPLGGIDQEKNLKILQSLEGFFRKELSRAMKTRTVPCVHFRLDPSFDQAERISRLIHQKESSHHDG